MQSIIAESTPLIRITPEMKHKSAVSLNEPLLDANTPNSGRASVSLWQPLSKKVCIDFSLGITM